MLVVVLVVVIVLVVVLVLVGVLHLVVVLLTVAIIMRPMPLMSSRKPQVYLVPKQRYPFHCCCPCC